MSDLEKLILIQRKITESKKLLASIDVATSPIVSEFTRKWHWLDLHDGINKAELVLNYIDVENRVGRKQTND